MDYPHTIVITRTAVTASATGGVPTSGATTTIYSGQCDAQEQSKRFDVARGTVSSKGGATVYIEDGLVLSKGIATGDDAVITWSAGNTESGRVESVDRLEDSFVVRYS